MHKEQTPLFSAPFFKKFGIRPFPISTKTFDIETGEFISELMDSLKAGYDSTKPIIISKNEKDDRIDSVVIDGRHRLYAMAKNLERGIPLPKPFPISYIEVDSASQLRALIASYEERNRSKASKYSKAWRDENLRIVVEDNIEVQGSKINDFIKNLGFSNDAVIAQVVDDFRSFDESKKRRGRRRRRSNLGTPPANPNNNSLFASHFADRWTSDYSDSVYASDKERLDAKISYHNCPDCGVPLKILSDNEGSVIKIESGNKKVVR